MTRPLLTSSSSSLSAGGETGGDMTPSDHGHAKFPKGLSVASSLTTNKASPGRNRMSPGRKGMSPGRKLPRKAHASIVAPQLPATSAPTAPAPAPPPPPLLPPLDVRQPVGKEGARDGDDDEGSTSPSKDPNVPHHHLRVRNSNSPTAAKLLQQMGMSFRSLFSSQRSFSGSSSSPSSTNRGHHMPRHPLALRGTRILAAVVTFFVGLSIRYIIVSSNRLSRHYHTGLSNPTFDGQRVALRHGLPHTEWKATRVGEAVRRKFSGASDDRETDSTTIDYKPRLLCLADRLHDTRNQPSDRKLENEDDLPSETHTVAMGDNSMDGPSSWEVPTKRSSCEERNEEFAKRFKGRKIQVSVAETTDRTQRYPHTDSNDVPEDLLPDTTLGDGEGHEQAGTENHFMLRRSFPQHSENPNCVPIAPWQTMTFPTCNAFHELHMEDALRSHMVYVGNGFWRDVWEVEQHLNLPRHHSPLLAAAQGTAKADTPPVVKSTTSIILKTFRYEHDMEDLYFEYNRVDGLAMERLTASKYVLDIYGFCGMSLFTEYAAGSVTKVNDHSAPIDRLKLARKVAKGLADIHSIDGDGRPSLVHNDFNANHVAVTRDGRPVFNDFNIAQLLLWDAKKDRPCGFESVFPNAQFKSPEEQRKFDGLPYEPLTEKVDIYAMGNVFFRFATRQRPWRDGEGSMTDEFKAYVSKLKHNGTMPEVLNKTVVHWEDGAIVVMFDLMKWCYQYLPQRRPTARQLVDRIEEEIERLDLEERARRKSKRRGGGGKKK